MSTYDMVRCDGCDKEQERPVVDWLQLEPLDSVTYGGSPDHPPKHFCGLECAALYMLQQIPLQRLPYLFALTFGDFDSDSEQGDQ